MNSLVARCFAALAMASLLTGNAWAAVAQVSVTPESVKQEGNQFSVKAERGKDGLIHFTISYRPPAPQLLVARFEVRDGKTTLAKSETSAVVREVSASYKIALAPKHLGESKFELSQYWMSDPGNSIAEPGETVYQIDLQAFGKDAPAAKTD